MTTKKHNKKEAKCNHLDFLMCPKCDPATKRQVLKGLHKVVVQNEFDKGRPPLAKIKWKKMKLKSTSLKEYYIEGSPISVIGSQGWYYIKINDEYPSLKEAKRIAQIIHNLNK